MFSVRRYIKSVAISLYFGSHIFVLIKKGQNISLVYGPVDNLEVFTGSLSVMFIESGGSLDWPPGGIKG